MHVNYKVIQSKEFIRANPNGLTDIAQSRQLLSQLADILVAGGGKYELLLDIRNTFGNLTHDEVWQLVEDLGQHREAFHAKIAILARDDEQFNRAVFAELCATITGFSVKAFKEFEDAINWIESEGGLEDLLL